MGHEQRAAMSMVEDGSTQGPQATEDFRLNAFAAQ